MKITALLKTKIQETKLPGKITSFKNTIKRKPRFTITLVIIFVLLFSGVKILGSRFIGVQKKTSVQTIVQKTDINRSLDFPGLDMQGKPAKNKVKLTITSAAKDTEVVVGSQTFRAKEGKLFLIINLELQNDTTDKLNIIPENLIRLTVGSDDRKYAPDLHNNTVPVAPISVKNDRIGFVIDEKATNLKLLVGELEKKKEEIELKF